MKNLTIKYKDQIHKLINQCKPRSWAEVNEKELFFEEDQICFQFSVRSYDFSVVHYKENKDKSWTINYLKYYPGDYWTPSDTEYQQLAEYHCLESAIYFLMSEIVGQESRKLEQRAEREEEGYLMSLDLGDKTNV